MSDLRNLSDMSMLKIFMLCNCLLKEFRYPEAATMLAAQNPMYPLSTSAFPNYLLQPPYRSKRLPKAVDVKILFPCSAAQEAAVNDVKGAEPAAEEPSNVPVGAAEVAEPVKVHASPRLVKR